MKDLRQSDKYSQYMQTIGWKVGKIGQEKFYSKKLSFLGNFVKIQRPKQKLSPQEIKTLFEESKSFAIQISYNPTKTLVLNIKRSTEEILDKMDKDTRYEIRQSEKNKIKVEKSNDIGTFIEMWHKNALKRGFWVPFGKEIKSIYEVFNEEAILLIANKEKEFLSGALILISDKTAYYLFGASTPKGRQIAASYAVIWQAIKIAKEKGCQFFDFEGVYDSRNRDTKNWKGFTHFKKGFGGEEIEYPLGVTIFSNSLINLIVKIGKKLKIA